MATAKASGLLGYVASAFFVSRTNWPTFWYFGSKFGSRSASWLMRSGIALLEGTGERRFAEDHSKNRQQ